MTSRQILESIRQDARRHQLASQETNIFYYDTHYNSDSDLESDARDKSESQENTNKTHRVNGNNYLTSIVHESEENNDNNKNMYTNKLKEEEESNNPLLYKVNSGISAHQNTGYGCAGSSTPTEFKHYVERMAHVQLYTNDANDNNVIDDNNNSSGDYSKSPYKTNTHVYKDDNIHSSGKCSANSKEDTLATAIINTLKRDATRSPVTSPSSSPSMSVLLDNTPIKANTNISNLSSDHTIGPTRRSSSGKVTVPMLALSTVHKLNYTDNLQLHAQYIKSLTSSPMSMKTTSLSTLQDCAQSTRSPEKANTAQLDGLFAGNNNNNSVKKENNNELGSKDNSNNHNTHNTKEGVTEEKSSSRDYSKENNKNMKINSGSPNEVKEEENNQMMLLLKLEDGRCDLLENNPIMDSPINLTFAKRADANSPSYRHDHSSDSNNINNNNNNNNNNIVSTSLNSLSAHRGDSISRIENSLALLQVELAKEKRHSIEAEQRAYALQREVETYKSENTSLTAALDALKNGNSILSEAISPRKPRDLSGVDVTSVDQPEYMAQLHTMKEQIKELQNTITRQETELVAKEERIRLLEHKLADQLLSGMLINPVCQPSSSSASTLMSSNVKSNNKDIVSEGEQRTSHVPKQIVHSVMLSKSNVLSAKVTNEKLQANSSSTNKKKMMINDANATLRPSEVDINHALYRGNLSNVSDNNNYKNNHNNTMNNDQKEVISNAHEDHDTEHSLFSSTLGDSHNLKTTKHPADIILSQRSVKTIHTDTNTNTNTNNNDTQASTNVNTGRTNMSNFSNNSMPDVLAQTRTAVQRLSTSVKETSEQVVNTSFTKEMKEENKENTVLFVPELSARQTNTLHREKMAIIKPTDKEDKKAALTITSSRRSHVIQSTALSNEVESNVTQITAQPQHMEKVYRNEPASARVTLPSPHTRLYENKYNVHAPAPVSAHNDSKESKLKKKSARIENDLTDGSVSSRRKNNNKSSKSVKEQPLHLNSVPSVTSARMASKGKVNKKHTATTTTTTTAATNTNQIPPPTNISSSASQEQKEESEPHNEVNVNVQESTQSSDIFRGANLNIGNKNELHKQHTRPPPLTEDALRHKEMPSMASLNSAMVINVHSQIHTGSIDTLFGNTQDKYNNHHDDDDANQNDMVNLEDDAFIYQDNTTLKETHNNTEKNVALPHQALNNVEESSNINKVDGKSNKLKSNQTEVLYSNRKTRTPRRASVPSPLRSSMSHIMTKPSPRVSQRTGASTPRTTMESLVLTEHATLSGSSNRELISTSTRVVKHDVAWIARNAMTPMTKPTNKTLFDNSHGNKHQRTGFFALSHFTSTAHPPSLMKKPISSSLYNTSSNNIMEESESINADHINHSTKLSNQESNRVNAKEVKTPVRREENNNKLNKQPQSARRPVSTSRVTFRQAITPVAQRLRSSSNLNKSSSNNKNSVLIECEDGKVKDMFDHELLESTQNKIKRAAVEHELMTPLNVHTEPMRLPSYVQENDTSAPAIEMKSVNLLSNSNVRHAKTPNEHSKRIASPRYGISAQRYASTPSRRSTLYETNTPMSADRSSINKKYIKTNREADDRPASKFSSSKMEHSMSLLHKEAPASEMLSYGSALLTLSAQRRSTINHNNTNTSSSAMRDNREHNVDVHSGRGGNENTSTARSRSNATVRRSMMNLNTSKTRPRIVYTGKDHETAMMKGTTTTVVFRPPPPPPPSSSLPITTLSSQTTTIEEPTKTNNDGTEHELHGPNVESSTYRSSSKHSHSDRLRSSSPTQARSSSSHTARVMGVYSSHTNTATAMRIINDPEGMEDDSEDGEAGKDAKERNENVKLERREADIAKHKAEYSVNQIAELQEEHY